MMRYTSVVVANRLALLRRSVLLLSPVGWSMNSGFDSELFGEVHCKGFHAGQFRWHK